jgi:hypothetical protein
MIICTNSTYFLPTSTSVVAVNCDPLGSSATHYSQLLSCSVFVPLRELFPYSVALAG